MSHKKGRYAYMCGLCNTFNISFHTHIFLTLFCCTGFIMDDLGMLSVCLAINSNPVRAVKLTTRFAYVLERKRNAKISKMVVPSFWLGA